MHFRDPSRAAFRPAAVERAELARERNEAEESDRQRASMLLAGMLTREIITDEQMDRPRFREWQERMPPRGQQGRWQVFQRSLPAPPIRQWLGGTSHAAVLD